MALIQLLHVLGVEVVACPPKRLDKKPVVERLIHTVTREWLYRHAPKTLAEARNALASFPTYYHQQRLHQGRACHYRTPEATFPQPSLPVLPRLPEQVDPDCPNEELLKANPRIGDTAQCFAVLLPVKAVGAMGDLRTYEEVVALHAVQTDDFMTADWARLSYDLLAQVSTRIVSEVKGVNRVTYDITCKPPDTTKREQSTARRRWCSGGAAWRCRPHRWAGACRSAAPAT